jgi:hypothetical protein
VPNFMLLLEIATAASSTAQRQRTEGDGEILSLSRVEVGPIGGVVKFRALRAWGFYMLYIVYSIY